MQLVQKHEKNTHETPFLVEAWAIREIINTSLSS